MWRNKRSQRKVFAAIGVLLAAFMLVSCGGKDKTGDVVAEYDGGTVTKQEYETFWGVTTLLNPLYSQYREDEQFQKYMVEQLVAVEILYGETDDQTRKNAEKTAQERFREYKELSETQLAEGENFENILKEHNVSEEDVIHYMARMAAILDHIEKGVKEEELRKEYDETLKEDEHAFTTASVRHILVAFESLDGQKRSKEEALKRAQEVRTKLRESGDFETLAKEYSDDPGSKETGGKVEGFVNQWVPAFRDSVLKLPLEQISEPVETEYGYHVLKVEKRSKQEFEAVRDMLLQSRISEYLQKFTEEELPKRIENIDLSKVEKADSKNG